MHYLERIIFDFSPDAEVSGKQLLEYLWNLPAIIAIIANSSASELYVEENSPLRKNQTAVEVNPVCMRR